MIKRFQNHEMAKNCQLSSEWKTVFCYTGYTITAIEMRGRHYHMLPALYGRIIDLWMQRNLDRK